MSAPEVLVVDYGVGNLLSVRRGLEYCGAKVVLSADPGQLLAAERVVLPGVGAFRDAMQALEQRGLTAPLRQVALRQTPLLGICLGMQLLLEESEEFGVTAGLGLIPGRAVPVPAQTVAGEKQKIPHIGWNALQTPEGSTGWAATLLHDNRPGEAVYFVHSFMAAGMAPEHRIADCLYGGNLVSAVIGRGQTTGCQFHPEKSGEAGLKILRRFILQ